MEDSAEVISSRRLAMLEKQAALYGPQTDPAVLIEIAGLKHERRQSGTEERRQYVSNLDYQFLMDVVAATLLRFNVVIEALDKDKAARLPRQIIHDAWMVIITVIVIAVLVLLLHDR